MKENTMKAVTIRAALAAALVSTLGLAGAAQAQSVVHGDQNFTWTFDTLQGDRVAALNKIAPQGFGDDNAEVYIAPNPIYNDY
jgi:hypothetical protein